MLKHCLTAGCPGYAQYRGYCRACSQARNRVSSPNASFYASRRWRATRRAQLFNHPLCQADGCDEIATDVHHVKDLADGGAPYAFYNLESLCHAHHSQTTRRRQVGQ